MQGVAIFTEITVLILHHKKKTMLPLIVTFLGELIKFPFKRFCKNRVLLFVVKDHLVSRCSLPNLMLVLANPFWLTLMITLGRHPWLEPNTDILNNLPVSFEFQSLLFQTTVSQPLKSFHILWTMKIFLELIHCLVNNELTVFLFISFAIMCSSIRWLPHLLILMCFSLSLWMPRETKRHNLKKMFFKKD